MVDRVPDTEAGEVKLNFIRNWITGESGFSTMEWRTLLANGIMTDADEADISAKLQRMGAYV